MWRRIKIGAITAVCALVLVVLDAAKADHPHWTDKQELPKTGEG